MRLFWPVLLARCAAVYGAERGLDTTPHAYVLFLDMREIEGLHNVEMVVNQAEKHPANRVAARGRTCRPVGYAWRRDGVLWNKPKLGLYEFRGSKDNNICWRSPEGQLVFGKRLPGATGHFAVFKDAAEKDPQKRYKGWNFNYSAAAGRSFHYPIYSPDGIHWTLGSQPITGYPTGDIGNVFVDDADPDPARRMKVYGHSTAGLGPDILHCIPSPFNPVIGGSNRPDPSKGGLEDTIHLVSVLHYKSYYIMLYDYDFWMDSYGYKGPAEIRARDQRVPAPKTGIFTGDTRLAVNRDSIGRFERVNAYQLVIARGRRGEWDSGYTASDEVGGITEPQWSEPDSGGMGRTRNPCRRAGQPHQTALLSLRPGEAIFISL